MMGDNKIVSGFETFDEVTNGFHNGELIVIGGRPAMGKTTLAISLAKNIIQKQIKTVVFISLELSATQLLKRLSISVDVEQLQQIQNNKLFIQDAPNNDVAGITSYLTAIKTNSTFDLIIIDYFQLLKDEPKNALIELKQIALKFEVPIILLSQLSKDADTRKGDHKPIIADLLDVNVNKDAMDSVYFLYRPSYYKLSLDATMLKMIVAKLRGEAVTFEINLQWDFNTYQIF
jgi:replicative DNA helicase